MKFDNKRYHTLNSYLRKKYGSKTGKLALNAGLGCPNRDGTVAHGGCIFCGEDGAGTFAGRLEDPIKTQIEMQKQAQDGKWSVSSYISYFQSYTNTYGDLNKLRELFTSAIDDEAVCGLAIATRPDCLDTDKVKLLAEMNTKTDVWVELGLQSIHEKTASWINRGYDLKVFEESLDRLNENHIDVVVHVILGLPGENEEDMLETICYLAKKNIQGIKIHLLHVVKGTRLYELYIEKPFRLLEKDVYVDLLIKCLELLPSDLVIHRVTGDGAKETLVAPRWPLNKRDVLNCIDKRMRELDTWQSKKYNK